MKKAEYIAKYGEAAYKKKLARNRAWGKAHREQAKARTKKWREEHPEEAREYSKKYYEEHLEQVIVKNQERDRKGGKRYEKMLEYNRTGLRGERNKIRHRHKHQYAPFKRIISPDSQLHHEWIGDTAEYRGIALVEKDPHQYGIIDVIQILDGEITLLTEEEVKRGQKVET